MKKTLIAVLAVAGFSSLQRMWSEDLVKEDRMIAATELPLDKETSKVAYQTATFGLG